MEEENFLLLRLGIAQAAANTLKNVDFCRILQLLLVV